MVSRVVFSTVYVSHHCGFCSCFGFVIHEIGHHSVHHFDH